MVVHATDEPRTIATTKSEPHATVAPTGLEQIAQTKLLVGSANDPLEREADRIARLVVDARHASVPAAPSSSRVQRSARSATTTPPSNATVVTGVSRRVQRRTPVGREGGPIDDDTEQLLRSARRGGTALDGSLQRSIGDVVGADLSNVRLHHGDVSADLSDRLGAEAFTVGNDVFFRNGVPNTNTDRGLGLVAHEVAHTVQQSAGAVSRRPSAERDETGEESSETPSAEEGETEPEEIAANEVEMSGTLPDITESVRPEDITGLGNREEDGRITARVPAQRRPRAKPASKAMPIALEGAISMRSAIREGRQRIGDEDALAGGKIGATGNITGPVPTTDAFGAMATDVKFSGVSWKLAKGKIVVDLSIDGSFEWEVYGDTNIDVSTPNSPVITAENYEEISADLTPHLEGKCWRPPREKYWSQALTERHEKYHASDADQWVKKKGPGVVRSHLKKNPIELTDEQRKDKAFVDAKLNDILDEARDKVLEGRRYYFRKNITDYLKYPGEIRAFGDGKAPYAKLAKGIKAHGKKLAKEKAAAEKSKAAPKAEATTGSGSTA